MISSAAFLCLIAEVTVKVLISLLILSSNINTEAVTRGVVQEKVFLEILQNSQENTCTKASFLVKLQGLGLQRY